jgi:hypothetical protein
VPLSPLRIQRRVGGIARSQILRFPLHVSARIAVVDAEFHLTGGMKAFDSDDIPGILRYAPEVLVLPVSRALALADQKLRGVIDLPSLKYGIVVLSSADASAVGLLESHHRDLLWKAFPVPVFEQLCNGDGRVVAHECEVHDGLHFDPNVVTAEWAGLRVEIVRAECDCGLEMPRLRYRVLARARSAAA